jgi:hypothetical protein
MKYAMLVYQSQETFDHRDDAMIAAGRAYGEALQAAGIFVGGAGPFAADGDDCIAARRETAGP